MKVEVKYSKQAIKFLEKNSSLITRQEITSLASLAVKKIILLEDTNINLKALKGRWKSYHRIRTGDIRIVFLLNKTKEDNEEIVIFFAYKVAHRGNVYD